MSNNRYYKYYLNSVLDLVSTKIGIKKFSWTYKGMLQNRFNYNFAVFRSSNGLFVYGAAYVLFGFRPARIFSSKSVRSKKRFPIAVPALKNEFPFTNKRKRFFIGIERFSVSILANRGAYGFLEFLPRGDNVTHMNVCCKSVLVNPEMVNLSWKMRSMCTYSVWFKIKSENLLLSWSFLRSFQIPVASVPFEYFLDEAEEETRKKDKAFNWNY